MPDVVRLPFHIGRDLANDAGVALANPDPDGPADRCIGWPGLYYITSQSPAAETTMYRWGSVAVGPQGYGAALHDHRQVV